MQDIRPTAESVETDVPPMARAGVWSTLEERLGARELRRRMWHILPGLMPVLLWAIPHEDPISLPLRLTITGIACVFAVKIISHYRSISREKSDSAFGCVFGYVGSVACALLLFPSAPEIGFAVFAILAFGDGSATLVGKSVRGPALPWNPDKTWSGFFAFIVVGLPTAALYYWQETRNLEAVGPDVPFLTALACCSVAVVLGAVAESVRSRLNDNIRVGVVSIVTLVLMHHLLVGWH